MEIEAATGERRKLAAYLLALALAVVAWGAVKVARGPDSLASNAVFDDTFYYLQTALNHRSYGFPSFDTLHPTNGFHPLWYLVILGLTFVSPDKAALLANTVFLSAALAAAGFAILYRTARTLGPLAAAWWGTLWFAYLLLSEALFRGMENGLVAIAFLLSVTLWLEADAQKRVRPLPLALAAAALLWARIDTLPYVFALMLSLGFRHPGERRRLGSAVGGVAVAMAGYALLMMHWGGTPYSIAGQIKTAGFPSDGGEAARRAVGIARSLGFFGANTRFYCFGVAALAIAGGILAGRRRSASGPSARLFALSLCLAIAAAAQLLVTWGMLATGRQWYYTPTHLSLALLATAALSTLDRKRFGLQVTSMAIVVALALSIGIGRVTSSGSSIGLSRARLKLARWLAANTSPDTLLASWNAGQIAYFSNRRTINLDGLVNSKGYADTVTMGKRPLSAYLRENGVRFVVDYVDYTRDKILLGRPIVHTERRSRSPKVSLLRVWDVSDADVTWHGGNLDRRRPFTRDDEE